MTVNSVRARQQVRNGKHATHWLHQLLTLLKSDSSAYSFEEFGIARLASLPEFADELCISVHLKTMITQCDHVRKLSGDNSIVYGRIRLRDLVDGKPGGGEHVSMIIRSDGLISFDGTTEGTAALPQAGYEQQICHAFAEATLIAVHNSLDIIK